MSKKNNLEYDKKISYITTIIFEVRSVPAVLYKALGGFATNSINLTKIESYMLNKNMNSASSTLTVKDIQILMICV